MDSAWDFVWNRLFDDRTCMFYNHLVGNEPDAATKFLPEPDLIFGWECPPEQRKPSVYPLEQIMKTFGMKPEELLVVDDLKPGYDMAKAAGVPFATAGWSNDIPQIESFMKTNCGLYFKTVDELHIHDKGSDGTALPSGEHQYPVGYIPFPLDLQLACRGIHASQKTQRPLEFQYLSFSLTLGYRTALEDQYTTFSSSAMSLHMTFCEHNVGR